MGLRRLEDILKDAEYHYGYRTEVVETRTQDGVIEQGHELRSEYAVVREDNQRYSFYSLGCFVRIDFNKANKAHENGIYIITCGHCLDDCKELVHARQRDDYIPLGNCIHKVHENKFHDLAVVKVNDNTTVHCSMGLMGLTQMETAENWIFSSTIPMPRSKVYKHGFRSNLTEGLIVGTDNISKDMAECYKRLIRPNERDDQGPVFQVLIASTQDNSPDSTNKFLLKMLYIHVSLKIRNECTKIQFPSQKGLNHIYICTC